MASFQMAGLCPCGSLSSNHFNLSHSENRIVCVSNKYFESTGSYTFIQVFKRLDGKFVQKQNTGLTVEELDTLRDYFNKTLGTKSGRN